MRKIKLTSISRLPVPVPASAAALRVLKSASGLAAAALAAAALLIGRPAWSQDGPQPKLPVAELTAGMHVIHAEMAVTPQQQAVGMMFRQTMGGNEGMLFVNTDLGVRCFWMRNTLIPLSIAFLAEDGTVVNIADMSPRSDESHCSLKPVRYALEVPQGWFAKRGFKAGTRIRGGPFGK